MKRVQAVHARSRASQEKLDRWVQSAAREREEADREEERNRAAAIRVKLAKDKRARERALRPIFQTAIACACEGSEHVLVSTRHLTQAMYKELCAFGYVVKGPVASIFDDVSAADNETKNVRTTRESPLDPDQALNELATSLKGLSCWTRSPRTTREVLLALRERVREQEEGDIVSYIDSLRDSFEADDYLLVAPIGGVLSGGELLWDEIESKDLQKIRTCVIDLAERINRGDNCDDDSSEEGSIRCDALLDSKDRYPIEIWWSSRLRDSSELFDVEGADEVFSPSMLQWISSRRGQALLRLFEGEIESATKGGKTQIFVRESKRISSEGGRLICWPSGLEVATLLNWKQLKALFEALGFEVKAAERATSNGLVLSW